GLQNVIGYMKAVEQTKRRFGEFIGDVKAREPHANEQIVGDQFVDAFELLCGLAYQVSPGADDALPEAMGGIVGRSVLTPGLLPGPVESKFIFNDFRGSQDDAAAGLQIAIEQAVCAGRDAVGIESERGLEMFPGFLQMAPALQFHSPVVGGLGVKLAEDDGS